MSANIIFFQWRRLRRGELLLIAFVLLSLISDQLIAQTPSSQQPWDGLVNAIIDVLTGPLARSIAAIVCVGLGYAAWIGKLGWKHAMSFIGGIVLVFSGSAIAGLLVGSVGGG